MLLDLVNGRPAATLVEVLPPPDAHVVHGPEGAFTHELIVPFVRTRVSQAGSQPRANRSEIERSFPYGTEWLYIKHYAGQAAVDLLLTSVLKPLVTTLANEGLIDRWFFIRFGDPEWHLRLRFHGEPRTLLCDVLPRVQAAFETAIAEKIIWRS